MMNIKIKVELQSGIRKDFGLSNLGFLRDKVLRDLETPSQGRPEIALVCYEKPEDFCHRHIVAAWLRLGVAEI